MCGQISSILQLEFELDLITENKDFIKKAMEKWRKIVPAVLKFSESLTGKYSVTLEVIRDVHKVTQFTILHVVVFAHMYGPLFAFMGHQHSCSVNVYLCLHTLTSSYFCR